MPLYNKILLILYKQFIKLKRTFRKLLTRKKTTMNRSLYNTEYSPPKNNSRRSSSQDVTKNSKFTAPLVLPKDVTNTSKNATPRSSVRGGIDSSESSIRSSRSIEQNKNINKRLAGQNGKENNRRNDAIAEYSDEEDDCNLIDCNDMKCLTSPRQWISDFAKDCTGRGDAKDQNNSPQNKWRERAAKSILSELSDDDDEKDYDQPGDDNSDYGLHNKKTAVPPPRIDTFVKKNEKQFLHKDASPELPLSNNSVSTLGSKSAGSRQIIDSSVTGEPRIVAPNVDKLSPSSVVELRLQSLTECVAVLCSVDVLKMRSGFFHQVLIDQEKPNVGNKTNTGSSLTSHSTVGIWREPITVPENSPFEAAAFLESLHEGRGAFKGDWNFTWTKLSVTWKVDDLIIEYANLIEMHINRLLSTIHDNHWRTNPDTLVGYRIAVFRKTSSPSPSITAGTVVDSTPSTGYSKIRVMFDVDKNFPSSNYSTLGLISPAPQVYGNTTPLQRRVEEPLIGDVCEPFWVQHKSEGSSWVEPDEVFANESKRHISILDKRIFWEMSRAIMDHPELAAKCKSGIRNARDMAAILKRPENKVLWIAEAPDLLPKEAASEIITFCCLKNFESSEK